MDKQRLYVRTPHKGNEFTVCDELTDVIVAIFYTQKQAVEYVEMIAKKSETAAND